uniref:Cytidine monophosphate-N-acetylneuraminic acid hydroxylase n=1 Tax=Cyprinus carpio TaxID=7962 RepID=A0A8C2AC27_CYPCA
MTSQVSKTVLRLEAEDVRGLNDGINFKKNQEDGKCYIIYKVKDKIRACVNQCKHQGGLFIKDIEDLDGRTVRCTKHYWKLNVATMEYVNPPDSFMQDELEAVLSDTDGSLELVELNPPDPWTGEPREAQELHAGEITLTYITHACMELKAGNKRMMFDPWLTGPAFARGWWLLHEPPSDAMDRLSQADLIYISHMHSDHLSYPTLQRLSKKRPDIPIYVGDTSRPVFWYLEKSGVNLTNINVVPFGVWQNVDEHLRFMILMDGIHPEMDTCLIVEYKGHMILNTVDCTRPNNGRLPHGVDVMMSDFAGGASGFPMTFHGGKYTESWKADFIKNERKKLLNYKTQLVKSLQPKIYCPFAGYFTEAHPSDRYIKETNSKNSAADLNESIRKSCPNILTWTPVPGSVLDLALALKDPSNRCVHMGRYRKCVCSKFEPNFFSKLNANISSFSVNHITLGGDLMEELPFFLNHFILFAEVHLLCYQDFYIKKYHNSEVIGYFLSFWNHFQTELPLSAPDWDRFLQIACETDVPNESSNACALF